MDILARFVGYRDFKLFCEGLKESRTFVSTFFTAKYQTAAELTAGVVVTVGWAPNRRVRLIYLGEFQFEVMSSENSQLMVGDRFELSEIIVGYPLYISRILRNGEYTPSYVAGKQDGINLLKVEAVKE